MPPRPLVPEAQGVADSFSIPAPLLGLNTRDDFTLLQPTEARVLENWLPDEGACRVRPGYADHQQISGATSVPTLATFEGASAQKLIAGADGEIWDVTGTPSALTAANYTNDRWDTESYNGFLFLVNGVDVPLRYNGTATSATGFTGPTLTTLQTVAKVRDRLWFTQTNSADVRYGGISAVTGALTTFPLSQIAAGGKCMAIGSWSRDAGDGADDFTVFVMSTGEVIVYQGDPATSFALVGCFKAPAPISVGNLLKVGGELIIPTVSGPIPVSAIIAGNAFKPEALAEWGKIAPSWSRDVTRYRTNAGWRSTFFAGIAYFVFPTGIGTTKIYLLNTRNTAPAVYTGMPVAQFAELGGTLYFGSYSDGFVYRHGTGSDDGAEIVTTARQGFTDRGRNRSRVYTAMSPVFAASGPLTAQFQVDTDFSESPLAAPVVAISADGGGSEWDEDEWDVAEWADDPVVEPRWYGITGKGRAVAPVMRTFSTADTVEWPVTRLLDKPAGLL